MRKQQEIEKLKNAAKNLDTAISNSVVAGFDSSSNGEFDEIQMNTEVQDELLKSFVFLDYSDLKGKKDSK